MSKRRSPPTNGSEIIFDDQPWASLGKRSNNCYAYAVNDFDLFVFLIQRYFGFYS